MMIIYFRDHSDEDTKVQSNMISWYYECFILSLNLFRFIYDADITN